MTKYKNYIYLTICEVSLRMSKETNFTTYTGYCRTIAAAIKSRKLSQRNIHQLSEISIVVERIFSLSYKDTGQYIHDFFVDEKYEKFVDVVRERQALFPNSGDSI